MSTAAGKNSKWEQPVADANYSFLPTLPCPRRACEPADSLVSLVSTNNLMLVIFKAEHVKEQKGFHGYFEVITQESEFVMHGNTFIIFFLPESPKWLSCSLL